MHLHFVFTCHNSSIFEELQRLSKFSWYKNMHAIYSYMLQYRRYLKTHRSEILLPRPVLQWEANIRAIPVLIAMWARVIIPSIYGCKRIRNRFREKMEKSIATKYPWIYGYFYNVLLLQLQQSTRHQSPVRILHRLPVHKRIIPIQQGNRRHRIPPHVRCCPGEPL